MYDVKTNVKCLGLDGQTIFLDTITVTRDKLNKFAFISRNGRVFIKDWDQTNGEWLVFVEQVGWEIDYSPKHIRGEKEGWEAHEAEILARKKQRKADDKG